MNRLVIGAGETSARLERYLLSGPALQRSGEHAGAVAGTVHADGSARYIYGEITGYYLHWLASLPQQSDELHAPAAAVLHWLATYLHGTSLPLTRLYLKEVVDDWRNQALFTFDLAMIAGGLAQASVSKLAVFPNPASESLARWLPAFVSGERLCVHVPRLAGVELPQRWSTTGGAFTAKTASRILLFGEQALLDPLLLRICRQVLREQSGLAGQQNIDMLHPTLYALEGCLLDKEADVDKLAAWFDQIVALQDSDGSLPESPATPKTRRSDIVAQALRVAVFLEYLLDQHGRYQHATAGFAGNLLARVRPDGSIGFANDHNPDSNIWSAMFAEQALRLFVASRQQQPLPFSVEALV